MLKWLRGVVVERFPFWKKIEAWAFGLPPFPSAIVTALGHGLLTAVALPFAPVIAVMYTIREIGQVRNFGRNGAPVYDSVLDIVLPWVVVAVYAFLLGKVL
jgi:hypothetical protein